MKPFLIFSFLEKDYLSKPYEPNLKEFQYITSKTVGISEYKFKYRDIHFQITDTGGQSMERRKLISSYSKENQICKFLLLI